MVVKCKRVRITGGKKYTSPKPRPEPSLAFTISLVRKCAPAPMPLLAELILLIEICIAYNDVTRKPKQCFVSFSAMKMVYKLLDDASTNYMVGPIDAALVAKP